MSRIIILPRASILATLFVAVGLPGQRTSIHQTADQLQVDSGWLANNGDSPRVVFQTQVEYPQAPWLRLFFDQTNLPRGSVLRLTGGEDSVVQTLDAKSLMDYGESSCFFNGGVVQVELVAGPNTAGNRVLIVGATFGTLFRSLQNVCGNQDDRVQSADVRQGRLSTPSSFCTGWLIGPDIMLSAGHCDNSGGPSILSFNVPNSTNSGAPQASHPDDQYPVLSQSVSSLDAGLGADWMAARVGANSNTGQLPGTVQGDWYQMGAVPTSAGGNEIRLTGYGVTEPSADPLNMVQKTHLGPLAVVGGTSLFYVVDSTGGNSGGPIIHENTGAAIGIHTHGGCDILGNNAGTRIDRADLQAALANLGWAEGKVEQVGPGCNGSQLFAPLLSLSSPKIGSTAIFSARFVPADVFGFLVLGDSSTNDNGVPLPLDLSGIGMPGCFQRVSLDVAAAMPTQSDNTATLPVFIPTDPLFIGQEYFVQYAVSDTVNPGGYVVSNALKVTVGG